MQKEIICHIGMPKAASTFIQSVLNTVELTVFLPRGILKWHGDAPPRFPFHAPDVYQKVKQVYDTENRFGSEYQFLDTARHSQPIGLFTLTEYLALFDDRDSVTQLHQRFKHAISHPSIKTIVCSHEDLCCGGFRHSSNSIDVIRRRNQTLVALRDLFAGMKVKIILVIRRQDQLLRSLYNIFILGNLVTAPIADLQTFLGDLFCYDRLIDILTDLFGFDQVHVLFFEELLQNNFTFTDKFLRCIIPETVLEEDSTFEPHNISLLPQVLEIMRTANQVLRDAYDISPDILIPRSISAGLEKNRLHLISALRHFALEHQIHKKADHPDDSGLLECYQSSNARLFDETFAKNDEMQKWRDYYLGHSPLPD